MRPDTIVAYTYQAETLCPGCINRQFNADGRLGYDAEPALDWHAKLRGIDRQDEASFDSCEFPKVVFADQIEACGDCGYCRDGEAVAVGCADELCHGCGEPLV